MVKEVFGPRADGTPLFSFWTHFPNEDLDADSLADATIRLQQEFDLDFIKTAPNGMYAIEDLGVDLDFSDVPNGGVAKVVQTPYEATVDWNKLPDGDIERGALARELRSLKLIRKSVPDVPIIFTVFSPMTIAAKLSQGRIHGQIAEGGHRDVIHTALGRIARTVSAYCEAAIAAGADGVFFAHQDTGRNLLSYDDFSEYVAPYDIEALAAARNGRFNILHIHGSHIRFRELQDYPVHAINWHDWETLPSATAGMLTSRKCIVGGIDRWSVTRNDVQAVQRQVSLITDAVGNKGDLIFAPSCTIRAGFKPETLHAIRAIIKNNRHPAPRENAAGFAPAQ